MGVVRLLWVATGYNGLRYKKVWKALPSECKTLALLASHSKQYEVFVALIKPAGCTQSSISVFNSNFVTASVEIWKRWRGFNSNLFWFLCRLFWRDTIQWRISGVC